MDKSKRVSAAEQLEQRQQEALQLDIDGNGFEEFDHIRETAEPLVPVWGNYLFRKAITMIVGDPGVCKTTMGYAMAMTLCHGDQFLGHHADCDVKVLYLDFESSRPLAKQRGDLLDPAFNETKGFAVWTLNEYTLPELVPTILRRAKEDGYNILVIDNQTTAFNTFDENDNAESGKQFKVIRALATESDMAIILYHHPSKVLSTVLDPSIALPSLNKGAGAGARARLADLIFNLNRTHIKDLVQFECCKDRIMGNQNSVQYIMRRMENDVATFTIMDELPPGVALEFTPTDKPKLLASKEIQQVLLGVESMQRTDIVSAVRREGISPSTIDKALSDLRRSGRVITNYNGQFGYYASRARVMEITRKAKIAAQLTLEHNGGSNENLSD